MKRAALLLTVTIAAHAQGIIRLRVDATAAPRRLIHMDESVPIASGSGSITFLYSQWIPGEHAPTGPIADVVSLRLRAKGETLFWTRDPINLYAFHVTYPPGTPEIEISFDFISPPEAGGFTSGSSMTTELAVLSWNQFLLYPQGVPADQLRYQVKLKLPKDWHYGTALPIVKESGEEVEFQTVPLTKLIDSPVSAGAHYRTIELGAVNGLAHFMHIAADSERAISISPEWVRTYQDLISEAGTLFGSRHYGSYHFLLTLSDHVASFGLEHHESSDDRLGERELLDDSTRQFNADLLAHEYVHSWNGKFRRPAGLITSNYSEPMRGDLLWVYEGLTEYLGEVLAARSGLEGPDRFRDWLATIGGHLDHQSGRAWRSLADTSVSAQLLYDARDDYSALRRGLEFYSEGALIWLEVDVLIRELSHGTKSIDDFCKSFYGGPSGSPIVKAYNLEELEGALNAVQPYNWADFFHKRVDEITMHAPLNGIRDSGWKLTYDGKRSEYWIASEDDRKVADLSLSLGLTVRNDGGIADVEIGSPAQKAGIAPSGKITSVNGRQFSTSVLREAVQAASTDQDSIELVVKNGEYFSTHQIDYHGGERYPHLVRDGSKPDVLAAIVQPRAKK